ncbi:MAG: hypothetical protein H6819_01310 [Phycisphaerales bacterium]|nr:hypothetical protein [Phycisphaerales bacterium]MCB9857154.1 hypothetical protein [Phycisphaerales bacterium]MCB9861719.1 hypothetical protein [Phycisphaerales bacterium]
MTRIGERYSYVIIAALAMLCTGCPTPPEHPPIDNHPRPEINRSDDEIVRTIRANEAKLNQALWSTSVAVVAHITDAKRVEHSYNLEGTMLFQRPRNLLINLRPGIGGTVMQVGSNDNEYWAWIEPELSQMWWGRQEYANKPCTKDVFVNPSELVAAMGIGLPSADSELIGPARKSLRTTDALEYMRKRSSAGYKLVQEYRVMRVPPYLVDVVIFYDEYGRKAMTASLEDYREAWEGGPLIAHKVSVIWPIENNKLSLEVGSFKNFDENKVKANAFTRPTDSPPLPASVYENIVQVDADCDQPSRSDSTIEPTGWYNDGTPYYGPVDTDEWPGDNAPALRDANDDLDNSTSARPPEAP